MKIIKNLIYSLRLSLPSSLCSKDIFDTTLLLVITSYKKRIFILSNTTFDWYYIYNSFFDLLPIPGQAIRPVDAIVFDRIRIGFHRNPTSFIKNRSDPARFLSDSFRSESDPDFIGIQRSAIKSDQIRPGFRSKGIRQKPCRIR